MVLEFLHWVLVGVRRDGCGGVSGECRSLTGCSRAHEKRGFCERDDRVCIWLVREDDLYKLKGGQHQPVQWYSVMPCL